ncbi:NUDIX hydrolase [Proteus mirabilis]
MGIRAISICIIENDGKIFVGEGIDEVKGETFYRPLGGGIEFCEMASETVKREFMEELNTEIEPLAYMHTIENIFEFNGKKGHEIVVVLKAKFCDEAMYDRNNIVCNEEGVNFIAKWVSKNEFFNGNKILYPKGLSELLQKS